MRYLRGGWSAPTMTALKYTNKKKRKGYWKIYDRARIKDFRKVWNFLLEIIKKLGNPFPKKDNRGRKPKLEEEYVKKAVKYLHRKIKKMFKKAEYITDSTKITTTRYAKILHKGQEI